MSPVRCLLSVILILAAAPATALADRLVPPPADPPTFLGTGTGTATEMVALGDYAYFAANDGVVGNELWRTDGTPGGTTRVADLNPGGSATDSNPRAFMVVGSRLFFVASTPASGITVYVIDAPGGAPQLTTVAGDPNPAQAQTGGTLMGSVNGKALLRHYNGSSYQLYALGASGTVFAPISSGANNVGDSPAATMGGWAYYGQTEGNNSATEPWRTDGTTVQKVKEIVAGPGGSGPGDFMATGNRVYFTANDGVRGPELWVTDGTSGGTDLVREHGFLSAGSSISNWAVNGNVLYYAPTDPETGNEVWRTEGTLASTRVVKDIVPGPTGNGQQQLFAYKNGFAVFRGGDIWVSDGTEAGTVQLGSVDGDGYGPGPATVIGDKFYFRGGFSPYGSVLWRSDGTAGGTFALTAGAFDGGAPGHPFVGRPVQLGSKIIFTGQYRHAVGDPVPAGARRVYVLDTTQADEVRQATVAPSISGTPAVGQTLTADRGTWTMEPNTYTYRWLRNGVVLNNATALTYTPGAGDAGAQMSIRVTVDGIGGPNSVTFDTPPVTIGGTLPAAPGPGPGPGPSLAPKPPVLPALTVLKKARLTGTARVGQTLKLTSPKIRQTGVKFSFIWYANGTVIPNRTKSSLTLKQSHKGKKISARITVSKSGFQALTRTVGPTGKVKAKRP